MLLTTAQKITLAKLMSRSILFCRRAAGKPPEANVRRSGIRWHLDLREGIDFSIYVLGSFEPSTVKAYRQIVKPGQIVLDIGANIGAHTLPLAQLVGSTGKVFAFEPTAFAVRKLAANVALNPHLATRISLYQTMLVADASEPLPSAVFSSWPLVDSGPVHQKHRGQLMDTTGARVATLDTVVDELRLARLDFIKLDVDGNEYPVLAGARGVLTRFRPAIAMEVAPYVHAEHGYSFEDLIKLVLCAGYRLLDIVHRKPLPTEPSMLRSVIPDGGSMNVLAVPQ